MTLCSCGCGRQLRRDSAQGLANTCYVRARRAGVLPTRPLLGTGPCARCGKVRKLYALHMCKSCYNVRNLATTKKKKASIGAT